MSQSNDKQPTALTTDNRSIQDIADDEVDDIIGIATEIAEDERKRQAQLDVGDVVEIGQELGLEEQHVEQAVDVLRDRQQADARTIAESKARRRKYAIIGGSVVGAVVVLVLILGLSGRSNLRSLKAEADEKRAQVQNVLDRQRQVNARYEGKAATAERDAELAGATNRVAIEHRRYDQAANAYNAATDSLSGSLGVTLFGMPDELPLSAELVRELSSERSE